MTRLSSLLIQGFFLDLNLSCYKRNLIMTLEGFYLTRLDTRLPQSRAGGKGLDLRSLDRLGRSSKVKE